jgi:hypothetical protein
MAETIFLDPSGVAAGRSQLEITPWIKAPDGVDWGQAEITAYMADLAVGSGAVDYRIPNRQVKIPLNLKDVGASTFATIISNLQRKVGLIQREGGWLLRQIDSTALYADVVNATLHLGGSWYQAYRGFDVDAELDLELLPDFYGDEVVLDTITATGQLESKLKLGGVDAVINGDYPARCRLVVADTSGNDQHGLIWGVRSRYYDPAATAALYYEADTLTPLSGATVGALTGASGGNAVNSPALPGGGTWVPILSTAASGVQRSHKGTYRVIIRAYSSSAVPSFRLLWAAGDLAMSTTNDPAQLPGAGFYLLDLGVVRLDAPPIGSQVWQGVVQARANNDGETCSIDQMFLQPLDEYAGVLSAAAASTPAVITTTKYAVNRANDTGYAGGTAWALGADGYYGVSISAAAHSQYLLCENCNFIIPSSATIAGILVNFSCIARTLLTSIYDGQIRIVKGGVVQATERRIGTDYWPQNGWQVRTRGGPSDLWGATWLPADIAANNFGVALSCQNVGGDPNTFIEIAQVAVVIYYTLPSGLTVSQEAVFYANRNAELRSEGAWRQDPTGTFYGPAPGVRGDLPRVPPSGLENRPCEILVVPSRGDLEATRSYADSGLDGVSVVPRIRPCYLVRP